MVLRLTKLWSWFVADLYGDPDARFGRAMTLCGMLMLIGWTAIQPFAFAGYPELANGPVVLDQGPLVSAVVWIGVGVVEMLPAQRLRLLVGARLAGWCLIAVCTAWLGWIGRAWVSVIAGMLG